MMARSQESVSKRVLYPSVFLLKCGTATVPIGWTDVLPRA